MSDIGLIDPGDSSTFELDWSELLGDASLVDVVHTLPSPLIKAFEDTDIANARSFVRVSGAIHGALYLVEASASLSDGETLNRQFQLRCFNG